MKQIIKDLEELNKQIKAAESQLSEDKGRKKTILEALDKEYGIKTLDDCDNQIKLMEMKLEGITKQIQEDYNKLKEDYDF